MVTARIKLIVCLLPALAAMWGCAPETAVLSPQLLAEDAANTTDIRQALDYLEFDFNYDMLKLKMAQNAGHHGDPLWDSGFEYTNAVAHAALLTIHHLAADDPQARRLVHETWRNACEKGGRPATLTLLSPVGGTAQQWLQDIKTLLKRLENGYRPPPHLTDEISEKMRIHHDALVVALYQYLTEFLRPRIQVNLDDEAVAMLLRLIDPGMSTPATEVHLERMWRRIATLVLKHLATRDGACNRPALKIPPAS